MSSSEMEPLSGAIVAPGGGPPALTPVDGRIPLARVCVGGPADGKVLVSASARLDYRTPSITVLHDLFTGNTEVQRDVEPRFTYIPKTILVLGVRSYRVWVGEAWWGELQKPTANQPYPMEEFESEVILRLIDGNREEIRACRQLP